MERFATIAHVHLVTLAVAEMRSGISGIAERTIISASELRAVTHNRRICKACIVKSFAESRDVAIHHVTRSHHVGTGSHLRNSGLCQKFKRWIVIHIAILDDAAMAMTHVFAKAHVRNHVQTRELFLDSTHGPLHNAILIISRSRHFVLVIRDTEQQNGLDAKRDTAFKFLQDFINRETELVRHGRDFFFDARSFNHEHRVNEGIGIYSSFCNHVADNFIST